jgi:hypothetical protein
MLASVQSLVGAKVLVLMLQCHGTAPTGPTAAGRRPEEKQTACALMTRQGEGWQSRERKLKELKHEGHIALGK